MTSKEKYIYESPDGGKTVTRRKFGETEKELLEEYNEIQTWKKEEDNHLTLDMGDSLDLDASNSTTITTTMHDTLSVAGDYTYTTSPSTLTLGGSGYQFEDVEPDLHVTVNGEERKMSEVIEQVDSISKRLKVLEKPDEKTLEKYKVLADIYEQYKIADAFLNSPGPEDDDEKH